MLGVEQLEQGKAVCVTTQTETHSETTVQVAGGNVRVLQDGQGAPVVVLHHSTGSPGWIPFYEQLAARHAVSVPDMPGYGQSERPEWARSARDMAILIRRTIEALGLGEVHLVGLGFGGWVAAELASMSDHDLASLTLIGAAGIQPEEGEIADVIFYEFEEYVKLGFSSDDAYAEVFGDEAAPELKELWDFSREMTARLTWKPWMFNRQLPHLLSETRVRTLLLWGEEDRVVPIGVAQAYEAAMPNATLQVMPGLGHLVELEDAAGAAAAVAAHIAGG